MIDQRGLQPRRRNPHIILGLRSPQQRRRHLTKHIQLKLPRRSISNPHRRRPLIPRQPIRHPLRNPSLPFKSIDHLNLIRSSRRRSQQPLPPRNRLVHITRLHQHQQRKRRIPQPAISIVPITLPANPLWQRSRHRRNNPTRRPIRQRLQRNQRPLHRVLIRPAIRIPPRPSPPEPPRIRQSLRRIDPLRHLLQRRPIRQHKRHHLTSPHRKLAHRRHPFTAQRSLRPQHNPVRPGHSLPIISSTRHPRNRPPIIKPNRQLHPHRHPASQTTHHPHYIGVPLPRRHKICDLHRPPLRLEHRLHNQRVLLIPPLHALHPRLRSKLPEPLLLRPQKRRKASPRRKLRPAKPINRAFERHQRRRLAIADQAIVFNPCAMRSPRRLSRHAPS